MFIIAKSAVFHKGEFVSLAEGGNWSASARQRAFEPPISLLVLPKEKRAVHGPKRKNAGGNLSKKVFLFGCSVNSQCIPSKTSTDSAPPPRVPLRCALMRRLRWLASRTHPGRGIQRGGPVPAPLSRFKGVRGEIEIPPGFLFGPGAARFSF